MSSVDFSKYSRRKKSDLFQQALGETRDLDPPEPLAMLQHVFHLRLVWRRLIYVNDQLAVSVSLGYRNQGRETKRLRMTL